MSTVVQSHKEFFATMVERTRLNQKNNEKPTFHIVLSIENDFSAESVTYCEGDVLAVYPENPSFSTEKVLQNLGVTGEESVQLSSGEKISFKEALQNRSHIASTPAEFLSSTASSVEKKMPLWKNVSPSLLQRFSLQEIYEKMRPLLPRFYSIASSQKFTGKEIHLTVVEKKLYPGAEGESGLCSSFLTRSVPLHSHPIRCYIHPTRHFLLPSSLTAPLIMIGPGTGIAPFRAFMQRRYLESSTQDVLTKNWLFFGAHTERDDFYYRDFWLFLREKSLLQLSLAFSRDQEEKIYVQHRMEENSRELWRWIQSGAIIYVCGDAKKMARAVDRTLRDIIRIEGNFSAEESDRYIHQLRKKKQYLRDIY